MRSWPSFLLRLSAVCTIGVVSYAQDTLVSIRTEPAGVEFRVDGAIYRGLGSFTWPKGSKHILEFVSSACGGGLPVLGVQYELDCRTRFSGPSWTTNKGVLTPTILFPFTADPEIHTLTLTARVEYRVDLVVANLPEIQSQVPVPPPSEPFGPGPGGLPGIACVERVCFHYSIQLWKLPGVYLLEAYPYEGFAFSGWGINGGALQPFQDSLRVMGPLSLVPFFAPGKRVEIYTEPRELKVLIDRTEIPTIDPQYFQRGSLYPVPGFFDWAQGSVHVLAAPSPQFDRTGKLMAFDSWVNGAGEMIGGQNSTFKVDMTNVRQTLVAKFIPGVRVSIVMPPGLVASVDGRENWASYNFVWGEGTKHTVTAPAEQYDKNGRKYVFKRWSNGGPATQTITPGTGETDIRLIAEYEMLGMLMVQSSIKGAIIQVDNEECQAPCTVHRPMGRSIPVAANTVALKEPGTRIEFVSWNDGTDAQRTIQLGDAPVLISAAYRYAFLVTAVADLPGSSELRIDPPSRDGYYPVNTRISVHAGTRPGFKFRRWEGDASGILSPAIVTVGGPRFIRGIFETTPHIAPTGIRSAAGEIPAPGVAPGSIISIFGASLAQQFVEGRGNPLVQLLGGTSVYTGNRLLPLLFVSPDQINAQLPYDLPEGTHTLTVRNTNLAEVSGIFTIVPNAPGLFTFLHGQKALAVATRVDGAAVTAENPIKGGELINVFGTGFGRHRNSPPDGFGVNEAEGYRLIDPVEILLGNRTLAPEYAGSAAGLPGVVSVRFRVPNELTGENQLTIRVNGVTSNTVLLPTAQAYAPKGEGTEP